MMSQEIWKGQEAHHFISIKLTAKYNTELFQYGNFTYKLTVEYFHSGSLCGQYGSIFPAFWFAAVAAVMFRR